MEDQQIPFDPRAFRKRKRVCVRREEKEEKQAKIQEGVEENKMGEEKGKEKEEDEEGQLVMETRSSKRRRVREETTENGKESEKSENQEGGQERGNEMRVQEKEFHEKMFCLLSFISSSSFGRECFLPSSFLIFLSYFFFLSLDGKDNIWRRKYILLKRHLLQAFSTCLDDQIDAIIQERVKEKMEREIEEGDDESEFVFIPKFP